MACGWRADSAERAAAASTTTAPSNQAEGITRKEERKNPHTKRSQGREPTRKPTPPTSALPRQAHGQHAKSMLRITETTMTRRQTLKGTDRRTFLKVTGAGAGAGALVGWQAVLRAQTPAFKIGGVHPVTGPLAERGQACRLGAQMAADAINAAGGIKSLGGAKIELILGDTQTKADVARAEAERLINAGAQLLMGTFNSGDTAA